MKRLSLILMLGLLVALSASACGEKFESSAAVVGGPAVEKDAPQVLLPQAIADIHERPRHQVLVALDQHGQAAAQHLHRDWMVQDRGHGDRTGVDAVQDLTVVRDPLGSALGGDGRSGRGERQPGGRTFSVEKKFSAGAALRAGAVLDGGALLYGRLGVVGTLFEQAAELRPTTATRARYNDAAHLLEAQVAVNAWHDAEATIPTVLAGTDDISSARTSALLRRVVRQLERAPGHLPSGLDHAAHELRQVLQVA